jgi:hypothetical protein
MFCPNCGKVTALEQKFCRTCGLSLEKTAQSLLEQRPGEITSSSRRKEKLERMATAALSVFGLGVLAMILYAVVYKVILVQGRVFEGLAILAFLAIVASGLIAVYLFAEANEAGPKVRPEVGKPIELAKSESTSKLLSEGSLEPVSSVTERTTDLLGVEKEPPARIEINRKQQ